MDRRHYWACIQDRFKDLVARKSRKICFDKNRDRFDFNARADIARLAIPKDSGFYLAPPPKRERLYSNLLGVSHYAPEIFVARTDLRLRIQMWDALRDITQEPRGDWVLTDKTLVSFHDLAEEPWRQLCDLGTVENFDSDEFAFAEDEVQVSTFTQLLYATLREKLKPDHIRYDHEFRYYHFTPTRELTPRRIAYCTFPEVSASCGPAHER